MGVGCLYIQREREREREMMMMMQGVPFPEE